jgi:hypothetical protein
MQGTSGGDIFTLQDAPTLVIDKKQKKGKECTAHALAHLALTASGLLLSKLKTHFDNQLFPGEEMRSKQKVPHTMKKSF